MRGLLVLCALVTALAVAGRAASDGGAVTIEELRDRAALTFRAAEQGVLLRSKLEQRVWMEHELRELVRLVERFFGERPEDPARWEAVLLATKREPDFATEYGTDPKGAIVPRKFDDAARSLWRARRARLLAELVASDSATPVQRAAADFLLILDELGRVRSLGPVERTQRMAEWARRWDAHVGEFGSLSDAGRPLVHTEASHLWAVFPGIARNDEIVDAELRRQRASPNEFVRCVADIQWAIRQLGFARRLPPAEREERLRHGRAELAGAFARHWHLLRTDRPEPLEQSRLEFMLALSRDGDEKARLLDALEATASEALRSFAREQRKPRQTSVAKPESLEISFTAVDGRRVELSALRGKVVLVDFWATWCGPCIAELPSIKKVYAAYRDQGFEIVGIALENARLRPEDTAEQAAAKLEQAKKVLTDFTAKAEMPWPQYFDGRFWQTEFAAKYGIRSIPALFLIDKDGKVATTDARGEKLEAEVKRLLDL